MRLSELIQVEIVRVDELNENQDCAAGCCQFCECLDEFKKQAEEMERLLINVLDGCGGFNHYYVEELIKSWE